MDKNNAITACCEAMFTKQLDKSELERQFIKTYGLTYEECYWTYIKPIEHHLVWAGKEHTCGQTKED